MSHFNSKAVTQLVSYDPIKYRRRLVAMLFWAVVTTVSVVAWIVVALATSGMSWMVFVAKCILVALIIFPLFRTLRTRRAFMSLAARRQFTRNTFDGFARHFKEGVEQTPRNAPFAITVGADQDGVPALMVTVRFIEDPMRPSWVYVMTRTAVASLPGSPDLHIALPRLQSVLDDLQDERAELVDTLMSMSHRVDIPGMSDEQREAIALQGD